MEKNTEQLSVEEKKQIVIGWLGSGSINVFGRPFAGKDVQCGKINEWLNTSVIGGGDIIRTQQEAEHLRDAHDRGELVPQDEFIKIISNYFGRDEFNGSPLIFSSIGRWHGEEDPIIEAAKSSGHPIKAVVYIDINEDIVKERFELVKNRGRGDDDESTLNVRLKEFREKTLPVIDFYEKTNMLLKINGNQDLEKVQLDIIDSLYQLASHA